MKNINLSNLLNSKEKSLREALAKFIIGLRVPAIKKFNLIDKRVDAYAEALELKRTLRVWDKETIPNPINTYLRRQTRRLAKYSLERNSRAFEKLSHTLLTNSVSFRVYGLHHVYPEWYTVPVGQVISIMKQLTKIAVHGDTNLEVRRVTIPKPNGKLRNLSVPDTATRIWAHMIYVMLQIWTMPERQAWQHGTFPTKGAGTAWEKVLREVRGAKFVYEFDLTKFFDVVDWNKVEETLTNLNTPEKLKNLTMGIVEGTKVSNITREEWRREKFDAKAEHPWIEKYEEALITSSISKDPNDLRWGLPQGLATSPLLATLTLEDSIRLPRNANILMYVDDGLVWGSDDWWLEKLKKQMAETGSWISEEKSHWIKVYNQWRRNIKFIGNVYNHHENKTLTWTRSGKIWDYPTKINWDMLRQTLGASDPILAQESAMTAEQWMLENNLLNNAMAKGFNGGTYEVPKGNPTKKLAEKSFARQISGFAEIGTPMMKTMSSIVYQQGAIHFPKWNTFGKRRTWPKSQLKLVRKSEQAP